RCLAPDELADDTLNRVARRLEEEGTITDAPPARYCYVVAKFVFLEYLRHVDQGQTALAALGRARRASIDSAGAPESPSDAALLDRLEHCLARLPADDHALILEYYQGEQGVKIAKRRALAAKLGLSANALSIRAC